MTDSASEATGRDGGEAVGGEVGGAVGGVEVGGEAVTLSAPVAVGARELPGRLAGLSLPRQVVALAIWPFFEQVMNLLVGTTDLVLAGHLAKATAVAAVDALGVAMLIGWLIGVVFGSLGVGSTALIARAVGAKHKRLANSALGQSMVMALVVGLVLGVVLWLLTPMIGEVTNRQGASLALLTAYLHVLLLAAPAQAILLVGGASLRGAGDTRTPFVIMVVVNVLNVVASVLLVFGPAPIGGHGVRGIAAGTVIAWVVGAGLLVAVMLRGVKAIRLHWHRLRPHAHTMKRLLRVGVPSLLENVGGTWLATAIVLVIVGQLPGRFLIGSHMVAVRIESFSFQPGFALGIAAATLVGQYMGLGDTERAQRAALYSWMIAASLMTAVGVVFIAIPSELARIITNVPVLVNQAAPLIRIGGAIQFFFATAMVFAFALRGAGDTKMTMKLTYASVFLVRVPGAFVMGYWLGWGLVGVWLALCADLTVRGLLFAGRFWHGGWKQVEV